MLCRLYAITSRKVASDKLGLKTIWTSDKTLEWCNCRFYVSPSSTVPVQGTIAYARHVLER